MPADRGVGEAAALQDRRRPKRPGGQDDLSRADRDGARPAVRWAVDRLDADGAPLVQDQAPGFGVRHDPGARRVRAGQVDPDPRALAAPPAPERAAPAVVAAHRVAPGRRGLPAERGGAPQDQRVLGRQEAALGDVELVLDRGKVLAPRVVGAVAESLDTVLPTPPFPDARRRGDARRPVHQCAPADRGAGEDRDRAVPGRGQTVVEVEPVERVELAGGHRGLVDERPGLQHHDRSPGLRQRRRDDTTSSPRAHDDDVGVQDDRLAGARRRRRDERSDRRPVRRRRWPLRLVADGRLARVRGVDARVGVREEGEQLAQAAERGPSHRQRGAAPTEQIALPGRHRHRRERLRTAREAEIRGP